MIATTSPDFTTDVGIVYHFNRPSNTEKYFMWRQAADRANGEIVIIVSDDVKLSKNFLNRCDTFFAHQETAMVQPTLVDAEGYIILNEYIRSYTVAAVGRRLIGKFNLGRHMWSDTELVETIRKHYPDRVIFDDKSYALHYGYPVKGGIDAVIKPYNQNRASFDDWVSKQRSMNNYTSIPLKGFFV